MREDWEKVELQDVCRIINGRAYKKSELLDEGKYRVLRVGNFFTNKQWYFSDLELDEDKYCDNGDLLYAWSASFGPRIWESEKVIYHYHIWKMEPNEERILKEYLHKFLLWDTEKIKSEQGVDTTMIHVTKGSMEERELPIPPLPEQKRIVAILDEAFEAIDQAKANIERNIENAEELFQSKLNEIFSKRGEGWLSNKLKDITTKIGSGATPRGGKKNYKESGISLIRSLNVYDDGFEKEKLAFIDEEQAKKLSNVELFESDVLLNITGASVARCCVVPQDYLPARVNQHVSIIRLKDGVMNENFLHYLLISKPYKDKLLGIGEQGATRQAITKSQIQDFEVSYPNDISEQEKLIEALDKYRDASTTVKSIYETKLKSLEELKKSILKKAFSSGLTGGESGFTGLKDEQDGLGDVSKAAEPEIEYEG